MNYIEDIKKYKPINEQEKKDQEMLIYYATHYTDVLTRTNELVHFSSSAIVVNEDRTKMLMAYHKIYDSWAWVGGHVDGNDNFLEVAIKEAKEETGVVNIHPITNEIFMLELLPVFGHMKNGKYVPSHLHANVTYLLEAKESDELTIKSDENTGVKWVLLDEVLSHSKEENMKKIYQKAIDQLKLY